METPVKNFSFYEDAEAFDNFHRYTSYYQRCQKALTELIQAKPGNLVMEVGCATGETTRSIARRYPDATLVGVDIRPEIIQEAKAQTAQSGLKNVHFVAADMGALDNYLPWEGRYPDVICSLYAFHHIPDPLENKFAFAQQLYELPGDNLRVVILDEVTEYSAQSPEYASGVIAQWNHIAQEAYRSVLLNRYTDLLNKGVPAPEAYEKATLGAAYTRDVELEIGKTTSLRQDEYPVSEAEMLEIWLEAGFNIEFSTRINAMLDAVFVMTR